MGGTLPKKKPQKGNVCAHCGRKFTELPYQCNYCSNFFCSEHHLPENHDCPRVKERSWRAYRAEQIKRAEPLRQPVSGAAEVGELPGLLPSKRRKKRREHPRVRKATKLIVGCAILAVVVWAFGPNIWEAIQGGGITLPLSVNNSDLEKEIFELINQRRIEHGLEPLEWDEQIAGVARNHSRDMANNNFFDHQNLQGEGPDDRLMNSGINYFLCGEVLLEQSRFSVIILFIPIFKTQGQIAGDTVEGWMNSPGHRMIILGIFDKIGVGCWEEFPTFYLTANLVS